MQTLDTFSLFRDGVSSVNDPQFENTWHDVFRHGGLGKLKWYVVAGNHDYRGDVEIWMRGV